MLVSSDSLVALENNVGFLLLTDFDFERAKGSLLRFVVCMDIGSLLVLDVTIIPNNTNFVTLGCLRLISLYGSAFFVRRQS